jgi:hypothetical protein
MRIIRSTADPDGDDRLRNHDIFDDFTWQQTAEKTLAESTKLLGVNVACHNADVVVNPTFE